MCGLNLLLDLFLSRGFSHGHLVFSKKNRLKFYLERTTKCQTSSLKLLGVSCIFSIIF